MTQTVVRQRNVGLDALKYLCTFLVIGIHMPFPFVAVLEPVLRTAVPVFFIITGYYYDGISQSGRAVGQLRKVGKLLLWAYLVYLLRDICVMLMNGQAFGPYLLKKLDPMLWATFLICNVSLFSGHLWYLGALLYALVVLWLLDRFGLREKCHRLIPVLLIVNLLLGTYSAPVLGVRVPLMLTRNFLGCGLLFLLLGDWLRKVQPHIPRSVLTVAIPVLCVAVILENLLLGRLCTEYNQDCFAVTPVLACGVFLLALECRTSGEKGLLPLAAKLGRRTSTTIYIIHPLVIEVLGNWADGAGDVVSALYGMVGPVVVLAVSTALALLLYRITKQTPAA